jgi:8-oxo-dGTP pyrophosphatase MutT (NUDIX family)
MIQVAMLWLANEKGELLLARRADHKAQDPGLWGPSVTGKLEPEETFEEAVVREAEEELALSPNTYSPRYLFETDFQHPDGELRRFRIFTAKISDDTIATLKFDTNEVAELRWLQIEDIKALLNSKPGEKVVASAFVLWNQIFEALTP